MQGHTDGIEIASIPFKPSIADARISSGCQLEGNWDLYRTGAVVPGPDLTPLNRYPSVSLKQYIEPGCVLPVRSIKCLTDGA